jgi:hypothetical protein
VDTESFVSLEEPTTQCRLMQTSTQSRSELCRLADSEPRTGFTAATLWIRSTFKSAGSPRNTVYAFPFATSNQLHGTNRPCPEEAVYTADSAVAVK